MKHDPEMAGAFPVGAVEQVSALDAMMVACLRIWFDGPEGPMQVDDLLRRHVTAATADLCLPLLETVFRLLVSHGRRPLIRHQPGCQCLGADEAVFAHFVNVAAMGEREDAMLIASLMVEGPALLPLTEAAGLLGLHLHRAVTRQGPIMAPPYVTLH